MTKVTGRLIQVAIVTLLAALLTATPAHASVWQRSHASAYGSGLFGNRTACGQTLRRGTVGVAHKTLKCGAKVRICHRHRCRILRVIDRGPYSGDRVFDLTLAAVKLFGVPNEDTWGERTVRWRIVR